MDKNLKYVKEFHEAFNIPVAKKFDMNGLDQRFPFFVEEATELRDEIIGEEIDPLKILKELCDVQYTLDALFLVSGLHKYKAKAMAEVHRSNMSKLDSNGKPVVREDGKILKSDLYSPADLSKIFKK